MKPIRLSIAGLHSFREEQVIDFEVLAETGMFGIFGPTGSGKSTILDAMTLALYGEVVRAGNHTQGILNHAEKKLYVALEFSVGQQADRRTFRVERHYKRGDEISVLHQASRLVEIDAVGEAKVLADVKNEVTKRVRDILGLEPEDFTRAVVLPQGKFSEFLRLSGAERNRMTERLFGLERYGQRLVDRLTVLDRETKTELDTVIQLEQQLGDASDAALAEAEARVREAEQAVGTSQAAKRAAQQRLDEAKMVRQNAAQLTETRQSLQEHMQADSRIRELERGVAVAHRAQSLVAVIEDAESIAAELSASEAAAVAAQAYEASCLLQAEAADEERRSAQSAKLEEERPLLAHIENLRQAEELERELARVQSAHEVAVKNLADVNNSHALLARERDGTVSLLEAMDRTILDAQTGLKQLVVSREERHSADELLTLTQRLQSIRQVRQDLCAEVQDRSTKTDALRHEIAEGMVRLSGLQAEQEAAAAALMEPEPIEETAVHRIRNLVDRMRDRYDTTRQRRAAWDDAKVALAQITEQLSDAHLQYAEVEGQRKALQEQFDRLNDLKWKEVQEDRIRMARILAESLHQGDACPVCGSVHHPNLADPGITFVEETESQAAQEAFETVQAELQRQEAACRDAVATVHRVTAAEELAAQGVKRAREAWFTSRDEALAQWYDLQNATHEADIDILWLDVDTADDALMLSRFSEGMVVLERSMDDLVTSRKAWERRRDKSTSTAQSLHAACHSEERTLASLQAKLEAASNELQRAQDTLGSMVDSERVLTAELHGFLEKTTQTTFDADEVDSGMDMHAAQAWLKSIANRQEQSLIYQEQLDKNRREYAEGSRRLRELETQLSDLQAARESARIQTGHAANEAESLQHRLTALTGGNVTVADAMVQAKERLDTLQARATRAEQSWILTQEAVHRASIERATAEERRQRAERDLAQARQTLQERLYEAQFVSAQEVRDALLTDEEIADIVQRVSRHREKEGDLLREVRRLEEILGGRTVSEEEWTELCRHMDEADGAYDQAMRNRGTVEQALADLLDRRAQWLELEVRRATLQGDWDRISDLRTTLRGNSFVEYLAREQLESVARDASLRLGRLTRGRYALEVMSDGGFVMRDHHNGGVWRPVSTLSGGETFLTSLALALSLSTQIQLRGRYPLEFFFLDEGFGTLDPELLDVVVSSLEQLHVERMAIGVISHVPELRQRLQRRLIVDPAEPAGRGSRVKVEMA